MYYNGHVSTIFFYFVGSEMLKSKHLATFYTIFINCNTLLSKIGISVDSLRTRIQESNMASREAAISD